MDRNLTFSGPFFLTNRPYIGNVAPPAPFARPPCLELGRPVRVIMKEETAPMTIQITKPEVEALINQQRREAIERLRTFGKTHGLSLNGMTIRELREQARP
jgi:hypothetical protein